MTAALDKALPRVPIVKGAFLLGASAPDLPLWLLSIGGILYYHLILGWTRAETARSTVDIFTHVDDGPLLLFPLNWTLRFHSAVSYYDDRYYGAIFQQVDLFLNCVFIVYLLYLRLYCFIRGRIFHRH